MQIGVPNITKKSAAEIVSPAAPMTAAGTSAPYVKPLWERTAFSAWVAAMLATATGYFLGVPTPLTWEQAKAAAITATLTAITALFFTKDSIGVPKPE